MVTIMPIHMNGLQTNQQASEVAVLRCVSQNVAQTQRLGARLGKMLQPGDLLCLIGDLGAGKTTFVQGIAAGWGSLDQASSPTFVLVNVYRRTPGNRSRQNSRIEQKRRAYPARQSPPEETMYHLDAYRLSGAAEALDLDLDSLLENGPLIIEWADRIRAALPSACLRVSLDWPESDGQAKELDQAPDLRKLEFVVQGAPGPSTARYREMLEQLVAFWNEVSGESK